MASAGSPLGAFINVRNGQEHDPRGLTLGDLMQMTPHEALMRGLEIAGEDLAALDAGQPSLRPAREVSDPWGARITADEQEQREGAVRAMQNIPYSPLAAGVELAAPAAYDALTREVPGANPEAPNVLAAVDNLSLGGLIEAPVARSLLRTRPPSEREMAPARLRGMPRGGEETAAPFYSQARTVVEDPKTQGTQTGEAWLKFMQDPKRGVKAEELEFTRLGDFLKERRGERVTRDEILGHLDSNEIEVKEVTKGARGVNPEAIRTADEQMRQAGELYQRERTPESEAAFDAAVERYERLKLDYEGDKRETKFSKYTLPGGKNYREVLLTLPRSPWMPTPTFEEFVRRAAAEFAPGILSNPEFRAKWERQYEEAKTKGITSTGNTLHEPFKGTHWHEPNVLAHLRLSDRDMDGKRTLLVEEIQSDWAQKGRREGFKGGDVDTIGWVARLREQKSPITGKPVYAVFDAEGNLVGSPTHSATSEDEAIRYASKNVDRGKIQQAPFVRDTSKWTALGLKRILKMAADEGYDRVAIVPGEEQAKRYDLSKQVDSVRVVSQGNDQFTVEAMKDGERVVHQTNLPREKLADTVGKELADQALTQLAAGPKTAVEFKGEALSIGGEGMKGFYDKIVPDALNKLAKEYGVKVQLEGGKVQAEKIEPVADWRKATNDQLRELIVKMNPDVDDEEVANITRREDLEDMVMRDFANDPPDMWGDNFDRWGNDKFGGEPMVNHEEITKELNDVIRPGGGDIPVHTLEVPPEMRERIKKKGFPLYSSLTLGDMMGARNA